MIQIGEICNRDVVTANKDVTVAGAAQLMRQHHIGDIVVVDDANGKRKPVGMLTDRDVVLEIIAMDLDPKVITVGDFMSEPLVTVRESEGVWETIQHMRFRGVRRIPVVDDAGALAGIISFDDVLAHLADELGNLARTLSRGREREHETRKSSRLQVF
jgi:CBS domain-containing protein